MTKQPKQKSIDLGALQDHFNVTKKAFVADAKALAKAQDNFDRSKAAYQAANDALKAGSRAVLD